MKTQFSFDGDKIYLNNPSLKYTLLDLQSNGVDIEELTNKVLGVNEFAITNFLKQGNLNSKNKDIIMKELVQEIHSNPYFYFSQMDGGLLFTPPSLALIYAVINRIPCIVEYSKNKKFQVDAFVRAVTNWFDLSYVESPICKLVGRIEMKDSDEMISTVMRRPSNCYMSLGSLYKIKSIDYMANFGLIIGETINIMKSMDTILVKLGKLFAESDKTLQPIRLITKTMETELKYDSIIWDDSMFNYPLDKIFNMIDNTPYRSIVIRF